MIHFFSCNHFNHILNHAQKPLLIFLRRRRDTHRALVVHDIIGLNQALQRPRLQCMFRPKEIEEHGAIDPFPVDAPDPRAPGRRAGSGRRDVLGLRRSWITDQEEGVVDDIGRLEKLRVCFQRGEEFGPLGFGDADLVVEFVDESVLDGLRGEVAGGDVAFGEEVVGGFEVVGFPVFWFGRRLSAVQDVFHYDVVRRGGAEEATEGPGGGVEEVSDPDEEGVWVRVHVIGIWDQEFGFEEVVFEAAGEGFDQEFRVGRAEESLEDSTNLSYIKRNTKQKSNMPITRNEEQPEEIVLPSPSIPDLQQRQVCPSGPQV